MKRKIKGIIKVSRILLSCLSMIMILIWSSCDRSETEFFCVEDNGKTRQSDLCTPKLMSYHFGVEHHSVSDQTHILKGLGMDGMMINIETSTLNILSDYYQTNEVSNENFQIYDVFTSISLDDPNLQEQQINTIEAIYKQIHCNETILQVIFHGEKENVLPVISRIADIAGKYDKELVIYPHDETAIESAEEARQFIEESEKSNVYLSVHLCHELAAGNGGRTEEVIRNVAPYIKSVSISGATESEQFDSSLPLWYWAIKPLSMGTYDYSTYFQTLYEVGYSGPVAIHTWGLKENFDVDPEDHLPTSIELINELAGTICD